ncbi:MAG: response regulator [Planctomycetes bacterium]|nr:response regulator [Planctomycetota bacterium]
MTPRVLLVDDSLTVRMDLTETLRAAGFEVVACGTLGEAREALARGGLALAILDVLLPDGDGVELLREIKAAAGAPMPVMMLSTEAEVRDRVRGLRTGADDYAGKPYDRAWVVSRALDLTRGAGSQPPGARPTILVIDDSATVREELRQMLEAQGYGVLTAETGEEGLHLAADRRPAAVIVDGVLPGIDGAAVVRRMRSDSALRRTPVLLLTASSGAATEVSALDSGADAYLRKDAGSAVVLARLGALLRSAGATADSGAAPLDAAKRILAVDDSQTYLQELARQLRDDGYDVVLAHSGEEALQLLDVQPVDCVLLDLLMPGLSGHETCRAIKARPAWRDIPLLMLTALDESEAMIEGINSGADDYITKSADFEVLRARLRAQLRRRQFEDENRKIREELGRREREAVETRAARDLAAARATLLAELEAKNKELESFTHSVSHDLRAPLRAVDGFCAALEEDCGAKLDEAGRRYLVRIRSAVVRMGRLIDDLLAFSRVGRQELLIAGVDMTALVNSVWLELREQHARRNVVFEVGNLPRVGGDPSLLRQAVENLLSNALKYSRGRDPARISFAGKEEGEEALFEVRDNGVGFDPKYTHKLFGVFQRLHRADEFEGTGVGLALVKRIVERHGGRVGAEGRPGEGASFRFSLPKGDPT